MNKSAAVIFYILTSFLVSCTATRNYSPAKKYPPKDLRSDYFVLKNILEKKHPSVYWYTSKDSMDMYFLKYYQLITDSMTEQQFAWHILAPLVDKIHCGHTSVGMSHSYSKWVSGKRFPSFPFYMKVWNDTLAVTVNLNVKDSVFKRGTLITSVNGIQGPSIVQKMFSYLPEDGFANNINYIRVSGNFPYYHRNIFGLSKNYQVGYIDSAGNRKISTVPLYTVVKDSSRKKDSLPKVKRRRIPAQKKLKQYRSLEMDSSGQFAVLTLNTFSKGKLRSFFRHSFKTLKEKNISNLVLDIRSNGGGRVGLSTLLTKYVSGHPFKVADSLYAVTRNLGPYTKYIKGKFLNNIAMFFIARKNKDGNYHIGHLERKLYKPKRKNHYSGHVYVLVNGPTFSAATIFSNAVKGQENVTLAGEETGGGWHGNNGIMIPDIILPYTKLRVRLPLFRLIQYRHVPKTGTGIIPDIYIGTSYDAVIKGYDKKMQVIKNMIMERNK